MAAFAQTRVLNTTANLQTVGTSAPAKKNVISAPVSFVGPKMANGPTKAVRALSMSRVQKSALRAAATEVSTKIEDKVALAEVAEQFNVWNAALQTLEPTNVAALYMENGVLLPTVSNKVRFDDAGKVDYFTAFLKLKPFGTINQNYVRFLSQDKTTAANSGIYTFKLTQADGSIKKVKARFTFVYSKDAEGQWKIVEHHSSAMPEDALAEISAQFNIWNSALQTGDPAKVAALYAAESVLLPTVSNVPRLDFEAKKAYFTDFLKLKPFGTIDQANVRFLDDEQTVGINSGIYTFKLVKDGKPTEVQARYSFVYNRDPESGEWRIVEHHSSAMPEPVAK